MIIETGTDQPKEPVDSMMMMMSEYSSILAMLLMEAISSGLMTFRWTSATKYNSYTSAIGGTNWW